jgi:hypothetical protein
MTIDSNTQTNQDHNNTPLWVERVKTFLCAIPLVFMEYAAVNYVNFSADPPARGERTELVLQFVAPKAR